MRLLPFFLLLCTLASAQGTKIARDSFSISYPAGWTIDKEDPDYDPDALFSFDSPDGNNMIMFIIMNVPIDGQEMLNQQVTEFQKQLIKNPEITEFTQWGRYTGQGKILKGKLLGLTKGFVRIFVYTDDDKSMLVVQQCYDDDFVTLKKDYELMEQSFRFASDKKK
ncbi:MAG: hypothetical protein KA821_16915 [Chitinophagaceae bacterium]|nr:hypothetical protein [Chitinophagaceae bacterium]